MKHWIHYMSLNNLKPYEALEGMVTPFKQYNAVKVLRKAL